jgi:hypothetical protein
MRFPIDVVFVTWPPRSRVSTVLAVRRSVRRARLVRWRGHRAAGNRVATLEVAAGDATALGVLPGAKVVIEPGERSTGGA